MSANNLRNWTVMVYFSADNDLQDEAFNNLSQLIEVGGSDNVHVLAQIDSREGIPTRRYFMRGPNDVIAEDIEGSNAGSIDDLLEFVRWAGLGAHKAKNYLIVLWGHGNGIFDDEDDVGTAKLKAKLRAYSKPGGEMGESKVPGESGNEPEDGDGALTSFELKEAFELIQQMLGQKVSILGMDACLMSMAEIAKQVSRSVELMVASEEVIPEKSWPYDRILQKLVDISKIEPVEPEQLARMIVDEYISCYESEEDPVTLSVCRLERIKQLAATLDELGRALTDLLADEKLRKAVIKARRESHMFLFREYVDLFDFCERLDQTLPDCSVREHSKASAAKLAAKEMMDVIGRNAGTASDFVFHCGSTSGKGGNMEKAHGVSIYFPPIPSTYKDLDLSAHTHWNNFVHEYMNSVFLKSNVVGGRKPEPVESERKPPPFKRTLAAIPDPRTIVPSRSYQPSGNGNKREDQPVTNGLKARLLLPKGTLIKDLLGGYEEVLTNQAFLMIGEPAEIKVPDGTILDIPKKGSVKASTGTSTKASTGTSTKASTGTSTKASTGTSTKASTGTSTKASTGTSTKAFRGPDGSLFLGWLDVPKCILNKAFSGGQTRRLRNGTRIYPPTPADGQTENDVEPVIVIREVKFVVDEPESYEEQPAPKARAQANYSALAS